jgi:hypothetical protein
MSADQVTRLIHMLEDEDHRLRAIQKLDELGPEAKRAVSSLWEIAEDNDGDPPVTIRTAAMTAILKIGSDTPETVHRLLRLLEKTNQPAEVRLQAARCLKDLRDTDPETLERLQNVLRTESDPNIQSATAQAVIRRRNAQELFAEVLAKLQQPDADLSANLSLLTEMDLASDQEVEALQALWNIMCQVELINSIWEVFPTIVSVTADDDRVLRLTVDDQELQQFLGSDVQIPLAIKRIAITHQFFKNNIESSFEEYRDAILPIALDALTDSDPKVRARALELLKTISREQLQDSFDDVLRKVQACLDKNGQGLDCLYHYNPAAAEEWIKQHPQADPAEVGYFFLNDAPPELLDELWKDPGYQEPLLLYVLATLGLRDGAFFAADWLRVKIMEIPEKEIASIVKALTEAENMLLTTGQDKWLKDFVSVTLHSFERLSEENRLLNNIEKSETGEYEKTKSIKTLVESGTPEGVRQLVDIWMKWVVEGSHATLVETTADLMRSCRFAVLPLVGQFTKAVSLNGIRPIGLDDIESSVPLRVILKTVLDDERLSQSEIARLSEWIDPYRSHSGEMAEMFQTAKDKSWGPETQAREIIRLLAEEKERERGLLKNRRIARQLADMSEARLFEEGDLERRYKAVKNELSRHAVPLLAKRLPDETDLEIRESLARTLGNVSGTEAVDALVRAIIDQEKKRADRQKLLAEYYLKPSKKQSEDAAEILHGAVEDAKKTLNLQHTLNIIVFAVGMTLLVAGTLTSLFSQESATRVIGALAGLGGLAGVVTLMIKDPLDRIQNAMANLVQLETAFTSFIWELNLNGTYIQSQYVAQGILTNDEIAQTVGRIEKAMSLSMNLVSVYTEEGRQRVVTRINSLSPAAGDSASVVTIHGQHLRGESSEDKAAMGMIAINHVPVKADGVSWGEDEVRFKLSGQIPGLENNAGTAWISLLIDGMETNALPFHMMNNGQPS